MAQKKHYKFKYGLAVGDVFVVDEATRTVKINNMDIVTTADLGDVYSILHIPLNINPTITDATNYLLFTVGIENIGNFTTTTDPLIYDLSSAINAIDHNRVANIKGGNVINAQYYHLDLNQYSGMITSEVVGEGVKHPITAINPVITKMCLGNMENLEVIDQNTIEPYTNMVDAVNYVYDMARASITTLKDTIANTKYCDYCGWFGGIEGFICPVCGEPIVLIDKHDSNVKTLETSLEIFTITDTYAGYNIYFTSNNPVTVKLPHLTLKENSQLSIIQAGAGAVTIVADDSESPAPTITINSLNGYKKIAGQYGHVYICKRSRDINTLTSVFNISGDLIAV